MSEPIRGHCKHGEFDLHEGCPQCVAERRVAGIRPEQDEMEDGLNSEGLTLAKAGEPIEAPTALVKINPEADAQVIAFYGASIKAAEYAEARVITTVDDLKPATDDLSLIAKLKKAIEEKRKEYINPLQDHIKVINNAFRTLTEPIETADKVTRDKILTFQLKQKLIREAQEEINRKRMEVAEAEMKLKGELTESVGLVEVTPETKRMVTDLGVVGMRDNWQYEVTDFALLPDEYKVADTAMLNAIAKKHHDQKQIPGVLFFNKPILAVNVR